MSDEVEPKQFGTEEARSLLEAGWTQGSVFRANDHVHLPHDVPADAFLVVCTQACSLVLPDLRKEPHVELAIARPVARFLPKDGPATGKDVRRFHLPVTGADCPALEIDITSRFLVPRELLLSFRPDGPVAGDADRRNLAGWIGRYYSRIALPDALVVRARRSVLGAVERFLKASSAGGAAKNHEHVHSVYVRWEPNVELAEPEEYRLEMLILCDDPVVADSLSARLVDFGLDPDAPVGMGGVSIFCEVRAREETRLTDLDGRVRLTEWDYMTGLGEASELVT